MGCGPKPTMSPQTRHGIIVGLLAQDRLQGGPVCVDVREYQEFHGAIVPGTEFFPGPLRTCQAMLERGGAALILQIRSVQQSEPILKGPGVLALAKVRSAVSWTSASQ